MFSHAFETFIASLTISFHEVTACVSLDEPQMVLLQVEKFQK